MKRYLMCTGDRYEASGGWCDLIGDIDDLEKAKERVAQIDTRRWGHVVDTTTMLIVHECGGPTHGN